MTDVGTEDALSHPPKVPEPEPLEPTIKYDQREDTISIDIEQKERSPLLGKALINTIFFFRFFTVVTMTPKEIKPPFFLSLCLFSFRMFPWSK